MFLGLSYELSLLPVHLCWYHSLHYGQYGDFLERKLVIRLSGLSLQILIPNKEIVVFLVVSEERYQQGFWLSLLNQPTVARGLESLTGEAGIRGPHLMECGRAGSAEPQGRRCRVLQTEKKCHQSRPSR